MSTASSNVMASSGPRFCSSCRKLAPLWVTPKSGGQVSRKPWRPFPSHWALTPPGPSLPRPQELCPPAWHLPCPWSSTLSPNLGTYLRGRGEDTGWQRSRLS